MGGAGEERLNSYEYRRYPYRKPEDCPARAPVVIVGAGLAGPTLALGLAVRGVASIVLDEDDTVSLGSRSICQAKHTLEVWDHYGLAGRMVEKGITWEQGEVYLRDQAIFRFSLQPDPHQKFPAFVNLQQYYVEEFIYERCLAEPSIDMRFRHKAVGVTPGDKGVTVEVETPDGRYSLDADWLVACDGVRSPVRHMMGLPYEGKVQRKIRLYFVSKYNELHVLIENLRILGTHRGHMRRFSRLFQRPPRLKIGPAPRSGAHHSPSCPSSLSVSAVGSRPLTKRSHSRASSWGGRRTTNEVLISASDPNALALPSTRSETSRTAAMSPLSAAATTILASWRSFWGLPLPATRSDNSSIRAARQGRSAPPGRCLMATVADRPLDAAGIPSLTF